MENVTSQVAAVAQVHGSACYHPRMKRVFGAFILCLLAAVCLAQFDMTSMAQMQAMPMVALSRVDVRKELKLSKDQAVAMDKITKSLMGSMNGAKGNDSAAM